MSKCQKILINLALFVYVAGAFLTNAYCRSYRWPFWRNGSDAEFIYTFFATFLWPVYWLARASTWLVENIPRITLAGS